MRKLNIAEQTLISGGQHYTCKEALELDVIDWDFDEDVTKFCTKTQFTLFVLGMVDLAYSSNFSISSDQDEMVLAMIRGLDI